MALVNIIHRAFENVAAHITNLDQIRDIVEDVLSNCNSVTDALQQLETKRGNAEITLQTDIQILINEILALERRK